MSKVFADKLLLDSNGYGEMSGDGSGYWNESRIGACDGFGSGTGIDIGFDISTGISNGQGSGAGTYSGDGFGDLGIALVTDLGI